MFGHLQQTQEADTHKKKECHKTAEIQEVQPRNTNQFECEKYFDTKIKLKEHMHACMHAYKCLTCNKNFGARTLLEEHMEKDHAETLTAQKKRV